MTPVRSCGASGCGTDSDIAMSRYVAPPASAARNRGMTKRGSVALSSAAAPGQRGRDRRLVARVEPDRLKARVAEPVDHRAGPVEVVVGHHQPLEEAPPHGDGRGCAADTAGPDQKYAHGPSR